MSRNSQNIVILEDLLKRYRDVNELFSFTNDQVFEIFAIQQIVRDANLSFLEVTDGIVDGGSDGGIDAFIVLINDSPVSTIEELDDFTFSRDTKIKVYISQAKRSQSFREAALDKLYSTIPVIFDRDAAEQDLWLRFNDKLVEKILLLRAVWSRAFANHIKVEISLSYICMANQVHINNAFREKRKQICQVVKEKTVHQWDVSFSFFSANELIELYQKPQSTSLQLRFKEIPTPIQYRHDKIGYIGVVSLKDYYDFIVDNDGNIREFILEENVRHYQGEVDVNKEIRKTIETDYEVDFWWSLVSAKSE